MISKITKRNIMGFGNIFIGVSLIGLLNIFNLSLESKLYGFQIKLIFFIFLVLSGIFLLYNKEMI